MAKKKAGEQFSFNGEIFSPRWGHTDRYTVIFTPTEITIKAGMKEAVCKIDDRGNLEWSGYSTTEPLFSIFKNDSILAPEVTVRAIEYAFEDWLEGHYSDADLKEGLTDLFAWINATTRSKPTSKIWESKF